MKTLKRGQIAVNRKNLIIFCRTVHKAINDVDALMAIPATSSKEKSERGKNIAKVMNSINLSLHAIEYFELGIPLKKLGTDIKL